MGYYIGRVYPELFTSGVEVTKYKDNYYFINESGLPPDTCVIYRGEQAFEASSMFIHKSEVKYFKLIP